MENIKFLIQQKYIGNHFQIYILKILQNYTGNGDNNSDVNIQLKLYLAYNYIYFS